jgi:hypothetical protein
MRRRLQDLSPRGAATAGVLTHLPGLVYLAALNAIVGSMTGTLDGVVQVAIYNAIWFSMAVIALILSLYRPSVPRDVLDELSSWTGRHRRSINVVSFGALGGYLVVAGVVGLVHLSGEGEERPTQGHGQSVDAGALPPAFAQPGRASLRYQVTSTGGRDSEVRHATGNAGRAGPVGVPSGQLFSSRPWTTIA